MRVRPYCTQKGETRLKPVSPYQDILSIWNCQRVPASSYA